MIVSAAQRMEIIVERLATYCAVMLVWAAKKDNAYGQQQQLQGEGANNFHQ